MLIVLAIVALSAIGHIVSAVGFWFFPWFWIAALLAVILLAARAPHSRRDR